MSEIIILLGAGRSGKSTYVHKIENGKMYEYLEFDKYYHYPKNKNNKDAWKENSFKFLNFLIEKLNNNKDKIFILDGYQPFDKNFDYLNSKLKFHKIKPIVIFENYKVIQSRGRGGAIRVATRAEIIADFKNIRRYLKPEKFVRGSDYKEFKNWGEVMRIIMQQNG